MKNINKQIAASLKRLRKEKGWSLDKTSLETSVSKAMLGQIERGESSPTIATLWKIANGFHVSFSSFLQEVPLDKKIVVQHSKPRKKIKFSSDENIQVTTLFPFDEYLNCEIFTIEILPHCEHLSLAHESCVIEHIIVVSGIIEVFCEGQWHILKKGEGLRFNADQDHGYRNRMARKGCFYNIIHYLF